MALDLGVIVITAAMADLLMSIGTFIGLYQQANALRDPQTTYTRKSSLPNTATYPFTLLIPAAALGLWGMFSLSCIRFIIWIGIYFRRAPEKEDYLGRVDMTYTELLKQKLGVLRDKVYKS